MCYTVRLHKIYEKIQSLSKNPVTNDFKKLFNKLKYSVENKELLERTMQDPEICLVLNELNQKNLGPEQVIAALSLHETVKKSETINIDNSWERDFTTPLTSGTNSKALSTNFNCLENDSVNFAQS